MKLLTHDRDKIGDFQKLVLLHTPVGFLMGVDPLGRGLKDLFIAYEENDDVWEMVAPT